MSFLSFQVVSCLLTSNTACLQQPEILCDGGKKKHWEHFGGQDAKLKLMATEEDSNKRNSETFVVTTASQSATAEPEEKLGNFHLGK